MHSVVPEDPQSATWDVVVIGAGAGGAAAGYNLARRGRTVLFLERGRILHSDPNVVRGEPAPHRPSPSELLLYGRSPEYLTPARERGPRFSPGCGTGGSTALFGMVMDRFRPVDFAPGRYAPRGADSSVPDEWPISYEEMAPFYDQAEQLFRVRGTVDSLFPAGAGSLMPPPAPTCAERALAGILQDSGLHPYRIHSACERLPDCSGCMGHLCPRDCKNDAGRMCLKPALERYSAKILPLCTVVRLDEAARSVTHAVCRWKGEQIRISGRVFILAANAFYTPALLLRSSNSRFKNGLGNTSGLVGRNLMLHLSDFLGFEARSDQNAAFTGMNHGIALNDFYIWNGTKLGNIHVHPMEPLTFATILEDYPYETNQVLCDARGLGSVTYAYTFPAELRQRNQTLLSAFKNTTHRYLYLTPLRQIGMPNVTHACGTCRSGIDPRRSVVNPSCRMHDLDNLYILDSSWFPSSSGINPTLTIIANSLRATCRI